jgi:hypothetical protein
MHYLTSALANPLWQFVATTIIGLIAIAVTIWVYVKQKKRKVLSYELRSNLLIFNVHEEFRRRVKIILDGKEIRNARMVAFRFANKGNEALTKGDFVEDLSIRCRDGQILSASIVDVMPETLSIGQNIENDNRVTYAISLLNPDESFVVKLALTGSAEKLWVAARITGGSIEQMIYKSKKYMIYIAVIIFVTVSVLSVLTLYYEQEHNVTLLLILAATLGYIFGSTGYSQK